MHRITLLHACTCVLFFSTINAASPRAYANDFIDPDTFLTNPPADYTYHARETIIEWADSLAAEGPWSEYGSSIFPYDSWLTQSQGVMNKTVSPPSSDKHDYMSWAP